MSLATLLFDCPLEFDIKDCNYRYEQQPGKAKCNPEDPLPLELKCRVSGNDNFTIQWHYSNSSSPPSQDNSTSLKTVILETNNMFNVYIDELANDSLVSVLTVRFTNFDMATGYYWCTVNANESTPNPSQVLHISICPSNHDVAMAKCMTNVSLSELSPGCADHNIMKNIDSMIEEVHLGCISKTHGSTVTTDNYTSEKSTTTGTRCADPMGNIDIEEVQLGCISKTHGSPVTTDSYTSEKSTTTDQSTISLASGYYVWMIVGIAFVLLIAIIIVMLIAIVYLNHKKNKIRGKVFKINRPCTTLQLILALHTSDANACLQAGLTRQGYCFDKSDLSANSILLGLRFGCNHNYYGVVNLHISTSFYCTHFEGFLCTNKYNHALSFFLQFPP